MGFSDHALTCPITSGAQAGNGSFPPEQTFWLFLSQVLAADGSCREVLRKFLAWLAVERGEEASPKTGAYCKARARLPLDAVRFNVEAALIRFRLGAQRNKDSDTAASADPTASPMRRDC